MAPAEDKERSDEYDPEVYVTNVELHRIVVEADQVLLSQKVPGWISRPVSGARGPLASRRRAPGSVRRPSRTIARRAPQLKWGIRLESRLHSTTKAKQNKIVQ